MKTKLPTVTSSCSTMTIILLLFFTLTSFNRTNAVVNDITKNTNAISSSFSESESTNLVSIIPIVKRSYDQHGFYNEYPAKIINIITDYHSIRRRDARAPSPIMTWISTTTRPNKMNLKNENNEDHQLPTILFSTRTTIPKIPTNKSDTTISNNTIQRLDDPCDYKDISTETTVIICLLVGIIVIGFIGNVLILIVLIRSKKLLRHPANLFIASLNACNVGVLITFAPMKIHTTLHGGNFCFAENTQAFACAFYNVIDLTFHICSVTHLFAISVERLMAIKSPFYHRTHVTRRFTLKVLGMVWGYSLFWVALSFIPWHDDALAAKYTDSHKVHFVAEIGAKNLRVCVLRNRNYAIALGILAYILPIIIMGVLYLITLQSIFRPDAVTTGHRYKKSSLIAPDASLTRIHGRKKEAALTKTVAIICVSFFICWMPSIALTIVMNSSSTTFIPKAVLVFFLDVLPAIPTCAFPIIYAKHYGKFGEELTNMRSSRQERILQMQGSF